ncbi:MAG: sigma-E processing peptidase SpoIIGA [Clostridia bacterium]|nr:sigma-E processing peptidase SpoIIGA [Clostridia bacterium]
MQVYIEYVLIDNLVIDYLLLKAACFITGRTARKKRLFFSAILGAVIALTYPLISGVKLISVLVKLLSGLLIVLTATSYKTFREYYITALMFFVLTFLTGGAIIGVFSILNLDYSNELSIAVMIIPAYLAVKAASEIVRYIYRQKNVMSKCLEVELSLNGTVVKGRGFFDTGNALYHGQDPVVIINKSFAKKLLGDFHGVKIIEISVKTVIGESKNLAFKIAELKIYKKDKVNIYNNVTVCVSAKLLGDGYDVILHPDFMEESICEVDAVKVKEVS